MGNIKSINLLPYEDSKKTISFGGILEEEMIKKFAGFNIVWYAPEKSENLEKWKAFSNVDVLRATNEEELYECVICYSGFCIAIMTGIYAENLFTKSIIIDKIKFQSNFIIIIYCLNKEYHLNWSKNYLQILKVATKPNHIFESLLKFQYIFLPNIHQLNYKIEEYKKFDVNFFHDENFDKNIAKDFSLKFNLYEKYCLFDYQYFKRTLSDEILMFAFKNCFSELILTFYGKATMDYQKLSFNGFEISIPVSDLPTKNICKVLHFLSLISVYFSKYPYLYGCFTYKEIEAKLNNIKYFEKLKNQETFMEYAQNFIPITSYIFQSISDKRNVFFEQKENLKKFHSFLIDIIVFGKEPNTLLKYPVIIKYLMDIDFCLKYFLNMIYERASFEEYLVQNIPFPIAISFVDKRVGIYNYYTNMDIFEKEALKIISSEEINKINDAIKIKDFIIIGGKGFHNIIKNIENDFEHNTIKYLKFTELRNYISLEMNKRERNFNYFLIIEIEEMQKYYKEIYQLKIDFALTFNIIVYSTFDKILINKRCFQKPYISIFIANNIEEIINYINSQKYLNFSFNLHFDEEVLKEEQQKIINEALFNNDKKNNEIKDENFDESIEEDFWELCENIPKNIFEKLITSIYWYGLVEIVKSNMLELLQANSIGDTKDKKYKYFKYFGFKLYPEMMDYFINTFVKQFLYAYTMNEKKNSLYYIINKELRSGEPSKINKYLELISIINYAIETKAIKSYKGQLYRATIINDDIINNKLIEGKTVANLSFWSSSKSRKSAEKFLSQQNRNVFFIIETNENNIDIDVENISEFKNEKEVLFIPYSKFIVVNKTKKIFNSGNKEFYEIKLKSLDDGNERNKIKIVSFSGKQMKKIHELNLINEKKNN